MSGQPEKLTWASLNKMALIPGYPFTKECVTEQCTVTGRYGVPGGTPKHCRKHMHDGDVRIIINNKYIRNLEQSMKTDIEYENKRNEAIIKAAMDSIVSDIENRMTPVQPTDVSPVIYTPSQTETLGVQIPMTQEVSKRIEFLKKLREHKLKYECPFPLCKFRCKGEIELRNHVNRHKGIKPFSCKHEWCDYRGTTYAEVERHIESFHSRKGFIRNLKQESRVIKKLKKWGLQVDTNITIDASRNGCMDDTDRKYSMIDMVVLNVTSCILILEVDEFAHESPNYNVSCELSRMSDINAFLRLNSYMKPIFWLRYNPNGEYFIGNQEKKVSREKRELALRTKIFSMMEPDFVPDGHENIHYMFYSRISQNGPPKILENPQFSDYVKTVVSWGE